MANISLGTLRDYWKAVSDWVTGATASSPKVVPKGRAAHVTVETNATTVAATSAFDVEWIDTIVNDGTDNITFNFDALPTAAGAFTLKPGEVRGDIPKTCLVLHHLAASGTQPFRAWGVK